MSKNLFFALILGLLFACQKGEKQPLSNPVQIDKYYPIKSLIEEQINLLDGRSLEKTTFIQGERAVTHLTLDKDQWRQELDLFIQSDINKASLASSYEIIEEENLLIHRLKSGEKGEIQEVKVTFEGGLVVELYIAYFDKNNYYTSSSTASMQISPVTGLLQAYEVTGLQKVWFKSPNEMKISAVLLPV